MGMKSNCKKPPCLLLLQAEACSLKPLCNPEASSLWTQTWDVEDQGWGSSHPGGAELWGGSREHLVGPLCAGPSCWPSLGFLVHFAGVWCCERDRLGPGTLCCSACTWTSRNKIQRNYKGLKITAYVCSWGKLWTTYKKSKNLTATSEEPRAKVRVLHMSPAHNITKGWAGHLSHPSGLTLGHTPNLTPNEEPPCPHLGEKASKRARKPVTCSCSPLLQQGPQ